MPQIVAGNLIVNHLGKVVRERTHYVLLTGEKGGAIYLEALRLFLTNNGLPDEDLHWGHLKIEESSPRLAGLKDVWFTTWPRVGLGQELMRKADIYSGATVGSGADGLLITVGAGTADKALQNLFQFLGGEFVRTKAEG